MEVYLAEVTKTGESFIPGHKLEGEQVHSPSQIHHLYYNAGLQHIKPVPAHILSLTDSNKVSIHVELKMLQHVLISYSNHVVKSTLLFTEITTD